MKIFKYDQIKQGFPKPYGKVRDFGEYIEMRVSIENPMQSLFRHLTTTLEADVDQDNTAQGSIVTPANPGFTIRCDENSNFTYPKITVTYLSTYTANETIYPDVYVFNGDNATYYVAKHIGFIRCVKTNYFDLVLIDKNIQQ
jgi:hypothetical protein